MEQSPLTLQARPDVLEPKINELYRQLFLHETIEQSEGFWRELFLLPPDPDRLSSLLDTFEPDFLIHNSHVTQQFVLQSIATIEHSSGPADEHALETLAVFLDRVLSKKYQSPSADMIEVLTGLDYVDQVFTDLVAALDGAMSDGRSALRYQAVRVALVVTSGAFNTSLLTYFTHRDLFPSLIQTIQDTDSSIAKGHTLVLLGMLSNCNKFETRNPYQARIAGCRTDNALSALKYSITESCIRLRDEYVAVQNDVPEIWSMSSTLRYVGLGSLTQSKAPVPVLTEEQMKAKFAELPSSETAALLGIYDFVANNKDFALALVGEVAASTNGARGAAELFSFSSYLLQHAYRSTKAALYSHLVLIIIRVMVEDQTVVKRLCEVKAEVRLCRQRPPALPISSGIRPLIAAVLDVAMDCINHNLRTRLDANIYFSTTCILLRICSYLKRSRTRLEYHWAELWRSLLSFVRFLTAYSEALRAVDGISEVVQLTVNVITICLTQGESFLPDTAALDDLFYKIAESHAELVRLEDTYGLESSPVGVNIKTLIGVGSQLTEAISSAGGKMKNVSAREVMKVIRDGYDTLSIEARDDTDRWTAYREQEYKVEIKKITRAVVADARYLASKRMLS